MNREELSEGLIFKLNFTEVQERARSFAKPYELFILSGTLRVKNYCLNFVEEETEALKRFIGTNLRLESGKARDRAQICKIPDPERAAICDL